MNWRNLQRKVATTVGGGLFGLGLLSVAAAIAIPLQGSKTMLEILNNSLGPWWAFIALVGGSGAVLVGFVVGVRYGHFERYHKDYDADTGRIESRHPFASLAEKVSKPETYGSRSDGEPPEKFEPTFRLYFLLMLVFISPIPLVSVWMGLHTMGLVGQIVLAVIFTVYIGGSLIGAWVSKKLYDDVYGS